MKNITKIDTITGRFNLTIENMVIGMCNEMQDETNAKFLNGDALKSIITEYDIEYESKFINKRQGENVINLMFFSNHDLPIRLENGDRRYLVIKVSNKRKGDFKYFEELARTMKHPQFYESLWTWLVITEGMDEFNPRVIPETEAKTDMIQASKESWQLFFEENINSFSGDGYLSKDCYIDYSEFCETYGYAPFSNTKFGIRIKRFVDIVKRKRQGVVQRYYTFNDAGVKLYQQYLREIESIPETSQKCARVNSVANDNSW